MNIPCVILKAGLVAVIVTSFIFCSEECNNMVRLSAAGTIVVLYPTHETLINRLAGLVLNEKPPSSLLTTPEIKKESLFSNSATVARDSFA